MGVDQQAPVVARKTFERLGEKLPVLPEEVVVVPSGTIPRTSSGKRGEARAGTDIRLGRPLGLAVARRS